MSLFLLLHYIIKLLYHIIIAQTLNYLIILNFLIKANQLNFNFNFYYYYLYSIFDWC